MLVLATLSGAVGIVLLILGLVALGYAVLALVRGNLPVALVALIIGVVLLAVDGSA